MSGNMRHQFFTGSEGEIVISQWVTFNIYLCSQFSVFRMAYKKVNVCRSGAMPSQHSHQTLRGASRRAGIPRRQYSFKSVFSVSANSNSSSEIKRSLAGVKVGIHTVSVTVPHFQQGTFHRITISVLHFALHIKSFQVP